MDFSINLDLIFERGPVQDLPGTPRAVSHMLKNDSVSQSPPGVHPIEHHPAYLYLSELDAEIRP